MSTVVIEEQVSSLESELVAAYQMACQTELTALKARVKACVAAHRLGTAANRLQPLIEEHESWGAYLQRNRMAARTVQRAQRIARCLSEEQCAKMTLTEADDAASAKEAVERGNMQSVEEWRKTRERLAELRNELDKQESDREKRLAKDKDEINAKARQQYKERVRALDEEKEDALERVEAEATELAEENEAALNAAEMAAALEAEGISTSKMSIPEPRGKTASMPPEVKAELAPDGEDEDVIDLIDSEQINGLGKLLHEVVSERANHIRDAIEDPQVQSGIDALVTACHSDADIAFAAIAVWRANQG